MADVKRVSGKMQLDTEGGGVIEATGGFTKVLLRNKEAARTFISGIGVTNAGLVGNKEAARTGMDEQVVVALVTKERVPEATIARMKKHPMRRMSPLCDDLYDDFSRDPRKLEEILSTMDYINHLADVDQDCLRQHAEKGYAEIGVDYTSGVRNVFILPTPSHQEESEKI